MTDTPPKPKRRRWRWLVPGLVLLVSLMLYLQPRRTLAVRAKSITQGMTRTEVRRIMGQPNMWFTRADKSGQGLEIGDCFHDGSPLGVHIEQFRRKWFGIMQPRRQSADYPIEVRYDKLHHVISVRLPE